MTKIDKWEKNRQELIDQINNTTFACQVLEFSESVSDWFIMHDVANCKFVYSGKWEKSDPRTPEISFRITEIDNPTKVICAVLSHPHPYHIPYIIHIIIIYPRTFAYTVSSMWIFNGQFYQRQNYFAHSIHLRVMPWASNSRNSNRSKSALISYKESLNLQNALNCPKKRVMFVHIFIFIFIYPCTQCIMHDAWFSVLDRTSGGSGR